MIVRRERRERGAEIIAVPDSDWARAGARATVYCMAIMAVPSAGLAQPVLLPEITNIAAQPRQTEPINTASEQAVASEKVNSVAVGRPGARRRTTG